MVSHFQKLSKEAFYNELYEHELAIGEATFLLFFSNAGDYIVIELEKQKQKTSSFENFNAFKSINQSLSDCNTKENLINTTIGFLKEFTHFDRIMVYQFDEKGDGEVIGEEKSFGLDSFLGLKYPASDIPQQARKLYVTNISRAINSVDDDGIEIIVLNEQKQPIDLSYSVYRSVSPVHIQYLKNMGVKATHGVSIIIDKKLWGMLIFHHYDGPKYLNFRTRILIELIANQFSNKIAILEMETLRKHEAQYDDILDDIFYYKQEDGYEKVIEAFWSVLQKELEICGVTLFSKEKEVFNFGKTPILSEVTSLHTYMREKRATDFKDNTFFSNDLAKFYEHWNNQKITGCTCLIISYDMGKYIYLWREAKEQHINWAGNPEKAMSTKEVNNRLVLTPRSSFDQWVQKEKGKSLPWLAHQKNFVQKLNHLLLSREINSYRNIVAQNDKLIHTGKELQNLLKNKTEELAYINTQLEKELKANQKYQKELEIALKTGEEVNAVKAQVLSNISHEIRTPITSIIGMTKIILKKAENLTESEKKYVKLVSGSAERLLNTTNRILLTSRIDKDDPELIIKKFDLVSLTKSIVDSMQVESDKKNIHLIFLHQNKAVEAYTDEHFYNQIATNLVSNAIKYTEKGGHVEVTLKLLTHKAKNHFLLSVEDNGVGILKENLEKVFDPFFTEEVTLQADKSSGVGLFIVKTKVEQLGGSISVKSEKGKGTLFSVLIPTKND